MRILLLSLILLAGCSTLRTIEPDTLPLELVHVSHASQHFGPTPTNYGYDAVSIGAKWKPLRNLSISVSEGVVLESSCRCHLMDGGSMYGGLEGPKEVFTGRIAYEIPLK